MPKSLLDAAARDAILARMRSLSPSATPRWGRMNAPQMLAHITDALRMAFGEMPCKDKHLPLLRSFPMKQIVLYWMPFPKGAPTAPELLARAPSSWGAEQDDCTRLVERFATDLERAQPQSHPLFGPLTAEQWGVLGYRHLDHHLRQFGV